MYLDIFTEKSKIDAKATRLSPRSERVGEKSIIYDLLEYAGTICYIIDRQTIL